MNEEGGFPILPFLAGAVILAYFGIEVSRQRHKLRAIFNVVDKQESAIAAVLEEMVQRGELKPYAPAHHG
jgi:hypothetical protein